MMQSGRIARAALAAALVLACSKSGTGSTGTSSDPVCSGDGLTYWVGATGQAEITPADLAVLARMTRCADFGTFGDAAELAAYVTAAQAESASPEQVLCAGWFVFELNVLHDRFACEVGDVKFDLDAGELTCDDIEGAVRFALAEGDGAALRAFFAEANAGANVCVCTTATGGTGGTGGSGSFGQ